MPQFLPEANQFISFDGAPLGLTVWDAETTSEPEHVVVGIHGMNDWAGAYQFVAPFGRKQASRSMPTTSADLAALPIRVSGRRKSCCATICTQQ